MTIDHEFLHYLISSEVHLGKVASSGFKSNFLDYENGVFSPTRSLCDIVISFYMKYRKIVDNEHLINYLKTQPFPEDQTKLILMTFEEVKTTMPTKTFEFTLDLIKQNYARFILQHKIDIGVDQLVQNETEKGMRTIKEAVFAAENVLEEHAVEGTVGESILERARDYSDVKRGKKTVGLPTGFPTFDRLSGGMKPGELIVVMAGPREGKSTFLLNVAHYDQYLLKKNVFFVSAENPKKQFERRFDACHSGLSYTKLRDGKLDGTEEKIYKRTLQEIASSAGALFLWDQPVCSPQMIAAKLVELEPKYQFDLIVVDYLSLLRSDKPTTNNWLDIGNIAFDLRKIARTRNIPVLVAAQVSRKGTDNKNTKYEMGDIALSYMVTFHADTVLALRVSNPDILNSGLGVCELNANLTKCRDGSQGEFVIDASFDRMKMQERLSLVI